MSNPDTRMSEVNKSEELNRSFGVRTSIFKAYDVRGVYPDELNGDIAYKVGFATAKFLGDKNKGKKLKLVVGEDGRIASPALRGAVIDAFTKAGADVIYIGPCTTPLFYFSVNNFKADGGIMVTASHNPPQYGGLKIVGYESSPIGAETGLKDIENISKGEFIPAQEIGSVEEKNAISEYVDFLVKESGLGSDADKIKIVIDTGNGMKPLIVNPLMERLKLSFTPMYFEIDCRFPNHSPDISKSEALSELRKKVVETKADLGVAFDGDGDRVMFVDEKGEIIGADFILALLYKSASSLFHKPKTVYDIRVSRSVKELLGSKGFKSRPGHSFIKQVMKEHDAELGGELSGHLFFREMKYAESSTLAMLRVIKILHESAGSMSGLIEPFKKYFHSGETNIAVPSREEGLRIQKMLKEKYKDGKLDETDGVTIEYPAWWFNLRLSNTEPIMRLVIEADNADLMNQKVQELMTEIKKTA